MLSANRHTRSLPSERWICNFKVVWLYHLFHRSGVHWTRRCAIWSLWVLQQMRPQVSTHFNVSYESECNRCWPDICQGPWKSGLWGASPKRRPHSLLSFVTRANCEPHWATSRTTYPSVSGPGTDWFTQVLIQHRASKDALTLVENILCPFRSRFVYLSFDEHDSVTANTQAVTHVAFLRWIIRDASQLSMIDGRSIFRSCDQYGYCLGFHRSISMGTWPLRRWNWDCKSQSHASHLFKRLACLCRSRNPESQRPYSNPSIC